MGGEYYLYFKEETRGPFSLNDMRIMFRMWEIPTDTPYWTEGLEDWAPMNSLLALLVPPEPEVRGPDAPPETDHERWKRERDEASWRREKNLLQKYGETDVGRKIINHELWIGQTEEQVEDALFPSFVDAREEKVSKSKVRTILKFDQRSANRFGLKVVLDEGLVVSWDDKR